MSDLKLTWNGWGADATVEGHDLVFEDGMATAVILSLFLDARARADDALPDGGTDRRGFWADTVAPAVERDRTGSRLWLLSREKTLPEVLRRAHDYAAEALRWLVEDGVASRVDVSAAMPRLGLLSLAVNITLVNGESSTYAFSYPLE